MLKKILRPVYGPPRAALQTVRGRRINRAYDSQYQEAKAVYAAAGNVADLRVRSLKDVGVRVLNGSDAAGVVDMPGNWDALVACCARAVREAFSRSSNCWFLPPIPRGALPESTSDVPAVQRGEVISLQLSRPLDLDGLSDLANAIVPELEAHVFGSFVLVDKVYAYRNLVSGQKEQVSWLWHYDNHPTEVLKLMVYLTDVDAGRAPFEYLRHGSTLAPLMAEPTPLRGDSRVAKDVVERRLAEGYVVHQAVGTSGTALLFDDNVIHRATLARTAPRDALVLQVRPATFRPERYIDRQWTGSFEHIDVNNDPWQYAAVPKPRRLSA
jgi:hypothetical protein